MLSSNLHYSKALCTENGTSSDKRTPCLTDAQGEGPPPVNMCTVQWFQACCYAQECDMLPQVLCGEQILYRTYVSSTSEHRSLLTMSNEARKDNSSAFVSGKICISNYTTLCLCGCVEWSFQIHGTAITYKN